MGFTHFDSEGNAVMADVSGKRETRRTATAKGSISMSPECYEAVRQGKAQKGDVLGVARVAGIMAVKKTGSLIPLCHTILIENAAIEFEFSDAECSVSAECSVVTTGRTGVEMEALTGVAAALLTIYDMCKAIDRSMEISRIRLTEKTGGKSGTYVRDGG